MKRLPGNLEGQRNGRRSDDASGPSHWLAISRRARGPGQPAREPVSKPSLPKVPGPGTPPHARDCAA